MSNFVPQIIDFIVFAASFGKRCIGGFTIDLAHHNSTFSGQKRLYSLIAQYACQNPVVAGWRTSSLYMSKGSNPCFIVRQSLFYFSCNFVGIALFMPLCHYDNSPCKNHGNGAYHFTIFRLSYKNAGKGS